MLALISFLLITIFIFSTIILNEKLYSPLPMFSFVWATITVLYQSRFLPLNDINLNTTIVIFVGVFGFIAGSLLFKKNFLLFKINRLEVSIQKFSYVLCYFCIIVNMYNAYQGFNLFVSGSTFESILLEKQYNLGGGFFNVLTVYFSEPFLYAILPIGAINLVKSDGDNKIVLLSMIIAVTKVFHHGGRATLLYYFFYILLFSLMAKSIGINTNNSKSFFKYIIGFSLVVGIVLVSNSRGVDNLFESLYLYICGCIPHLDIRLQYLDSKDYTWGMTSAYGIISIFLFIIKGIFGTYPEFFYYVQNIVNVESVEYIGSGIGYNAFVTPFYYLYADGGIVAVFCGMLILGLLSQMIYIYSIKTKRDDIIILYSLIAFQIVFSMIRLHFVTYQYILSFIYVLIMYSKIKFKYH